MLHGQHGMAVAGDAVDLEQRTGLGMVPVRSEKSTSASSLTWATSVNQRIVLEDPVRRGVGTSERKDYRHTTLFRILF